MKIAHLISILLLGLVLGACASSPPQAPSNSGVINAKSEPPITSVPTTTSIPTSTNSPTSTSAPTTTSVPATQSVVTQAQTNPDDLVRMDTQGAVEFAVQPLNLDNLGDSIVFKVSMNTHSVDLGMDIAPLATLSADNGYSAQAISWDGPLGGHHVSGILSFPAQVDGKGLLDGAAIITLTIVDVDVPERAFVWELGK